MSETFRERFWNSMGVVFLIWMAVEGIVKPLLKVWECK